MLGPTRLQGARIANRTLTLGLTLAVVGVVLAATATTASAAQDADAKTASLKVGQDAPSFELTGSDGKTYKLEDFQGKQAFVIAWFPKAFTGGCTAQCKSFRDNGEAIKKFDVAYFTASVDAADDNKRFAESLELDYPILSDPEKTVAKAYGVLNARGMASRITIYVNKDGKIAFIDDEVQAKVDGKTVADRLAEMKVAKKSTDDIKQAGQ